MSVDQYDQALAEAAAVLFIDNEYDSVASSDLVKAHFGGIILGKEVGSTITKKLPKIRKILAEEYGLSTTLVTIKAVNRYIKRGKRPQTDDELIECIPVGHGKKGYALMATKYCPPLFDLMETYNSKSAVGKVVATTERVQLGVDKGFIEGDSKASLGITSGAGLTRDDGPLLTEGGEDDQPTVL